MKKSLVIIFSTILSILILIAHSISFAQGTSTNVLVRQIGISTYFYKVSNVSNKQIVEVMIGYNYNREDEEGEGNELLVEAKAIESPSGWAGYTVFLEESNYLHISWRILDHAFVISSGKSLDGFVAYMPQSYDLMKQASFSIIYDDGTVMSSTVQLDPSPPTLFDGKGQRPADVNSFLSYLKPLEAQTTLSQGQTTYYLLTFYGKTIQPQTFKAILNGIDIKSSFHPNADTSETVKLNLKQGRNTLVLSVDGIRNDGRKATDTDRLVFIAP